MSILRYLFWIKEDQVTAVRCESSGMYIEKFRGRSTVFFDNTYWKEWIEYSGMVSGDKLDFCYIYDKKPPINEEIEAAQCNDNDAGWSRARIEEALVKLSSIVTVPTEIKTENGIFLTRVGNFRHIKKEDIVTATASFIRPCQNAKQAEKDVLVFSSANKTPMQIYYYNQLQEHKKGHTK